MKKGFTLMELLLVVAVLAIVAAAAAPTFFGGAQEAMEEAKKSSFMSAYQNTMSGANLMVSIAASQGNIPTGACALDGASDSLTWAANNLSHYAPVASRQFSTLKGTSGSFSANYDATTGVYAVATIGNTTQEIKPANGETVSDALANAWNAVKNN